MFRRKYADLVRNQSIAASSANEIARLRAIDERVKEYQVELANMRAGRVAEYFQQEWKGQIDLAAKAGDRSVTLKIGERKGHGNSTTPRQDAISTAGVEFLNSLGFTVRAQNVHNWDECNISTSRVCLYLHVSW